MLELVLFAVVIGVVWLLVKRGWKRETLDEIENRTRAEIEQLKVEMAAKAEKKSAKDRAS